MEEPYLLTSAWESCINETLQIEAFEPKLKGLSDQLITLREGRAPCSEWLERFAADLKALGEIVSAVAVQLDDISNEYDRCHLIHEADLISSLALRLHIIAKGANDVDTLNIARRIERRHQGRALRQQERRLPRMRRLN